MRTALWTIALAAGVLWPARSFSMFDGVPLDGRAEAVLVGVIVPALWWLDRSFFDRTGARALIVALLALKMGGAFLGQDGLCARFSTPAPLVGTILTMPIDEPRGVLRSWDVRADWRAEQPSCTAILDRPYRSAAEFPAWFVNILDQLRPGHRDVRMTIAGAITVPDAGELSFATGEDMRLGGRVDDAVIAIGGGRDVRVALTAGTHAVRLEGSLTGERWRFEPIWNGSPAWRAALFTLAPPTAAGLVTRRAIAVLTPLIVIALVAWWAIDAIVRVHPGAAPLAWTAAATLTLVAVAVTGRFERFAGLLLVGSALVPVATRNRNLRTAFVMAGVPWLAYFVARAMPLVGHVSIYSWDDWLAYQVAGSRIYMHGFWLEGGTKTFDYQALYRWLSGALHVVFGDSSVGESYFDAACLLAGSLVAFALVRPYGGFRAAMLACTGTLATFTLGTPWYFVGRGLSEIAAAGFGFGAALLLLRAKHGAWTMAIAAGGCAVLMFYARQNQLLFAASLAALLLPLATRTDVRSLLPALRRVRWAAAAWYAAVCAAGVALFAARTWWYTGAFSLLYGTSLKNNDTGLRPSTMLSAAPWRNIAHSLAALVWMNEPPHADPRAVLVAAGCVMAVAALCQVPRLREIPAPIALALAGATLSSFLAHTHGYPGRMSIHLVPFAVSAAILGSLALVRAGARRAS